MERCSTPVSFYARAGGCGLFGVPQSFEYLIEADLPLEGSLRRIGREGAHSTEPSCAVAARRWGIGGLDGQEFGNFDSKAFCSPGKDGLCEAKTTRSSRSRSVIEARPVLGAAEPGR